jgi:glycosyltransferase involved in cell wall biosynthesis
VSSPFVSCVMPTQASRAQFVPQAIWYFLRQDYADRELIVLDDPEGTLVDLVPDDERICYVRLSEPLPLGAKRNMACAAARGDVIVHWDDDDWSAPHRISAQVAALERSATDACGCVDLLHYALEDGEAWLYRHRPEGWPWLAGCSLAYRRSAWESCAFPALPVGEDSAWVRQLEPSAVHALGAQDLLVAVVHGGNSGSKYFPDPRWERRDFDEVLRTLGPDCAFYERLRNGAAPRRRAAPRRASSAVTLFSPFAVWDGYGSVAEHLALGLARASVELAVMPTMLDRGGLPPELLGLIDSAQPVPGAVALLFGVPTAGVTQRVDEELFINTMWEADRLPASWIAPLNAARAVIVPTRFVAAAARASGVVTPIEVVPEGIDPARYPYIERPRRAGLTTLIVGMVNRRKKTLQAIAAWKQAFADDPEARLIIKSRFQLGNYTPDDPRIRLVDTNELTAGIAHWYREADVLLQLGNEGFGLPLVEGMATGLPAIALISEGHGDIHEDAPECLLAVEAASMEPCDDTRYGLAGERGVPDVGQAAAHLRWIDEHRDQARAMGRRASRWVHAERNIWSKAPAVIDVMERYARPRRALRPRPVLWAPDAAGNDELAAALGVARSSGRVPDVGVHSLVHVIHGGAGPDDVELTRFVLEASAQRVPVVVTEPAPSGCAGNGHRRGSSSSRPAARHGSVRRRALPATRTAYPSWPPSPSRRPASGRRSRRPARSRPGSLSWAWSAPSYRATSTPPRPAWSSRSIRPSPPLRPRGGSRPRRTSSCCGTRRRAT